MIKALLIVSLSLCLASLVSTRSKMLRVISAKWALDIVAVLILGATGLLEIASVYAFAFILIVFGTLFSFLWITLRTEGLRDRG